VICEGVELNLFSESFHFNPVHKAGLNDLDMNQTDLILYFDSLNELIRDEVVKGLVYLKKKKKKKTFADNLLTPISSRMSQYFFL